MKKDDIKKLACLGLCIVLFAAFSYVIPDFWNLDISYKNEKMDIHIPNVVSDEVQEINFTLPVLYVYSYEKDKLIPYWQWSVDGPVMPIREESFVDLYVFDENLNNLENTPSHIYYNEMMKLRGRTSSYMQDKKPFSLEFRDDNNMQINYNFLGFKADSDFVFHAPYIDRSLIRNYIAYTLQMQLTDWSPACQFAEVFVDTPDSELTMEDYQGVYLIVEKIKQDKNRIAMGEYKAPDNMDTIFSEGGNYIFKDDAYEEGYDEAIRLEANRFGNRYSVAYPNADSLTEQDINAIKDEIDFFESALYEGTDEEFAQYYDIEEIARVMLLAEFLKNYEGFSSSLYFYRPQNERIKVIQWDFDIGTGNIDYNKDLQNAYGFDVMKKQETKPYLSHENFQQALISQWRNLRKEGNIFSEENIIALLDDAETQLNGAWQRNDQKYDYIFKRVPFANANNNLENSQQEREYIKQFLIERGRWLDEHIDEVSKFY